LPTWLDDEHLVFVANNQLTVIDTAKHRRVIGGPFPFELNTAVLPAISPDGRTLFIAGGRNESDVWMVQRESR